MTCHKQIASVCWKSQRSSNDLPVVHLCVLRLQLLPGHVGHPAPWWRPGPTFIQKCKRWTVCHQLDNYCELLCFTAILPPSASLRRNETNLDILCKVKKFLSNLLLFATNNKTIKRYQTILFSYDSEWTEVTITQCSGNWQCSRWCHDVMMTTIVYNHTITLMLKCNANKQ